MKRKILFPILILCSVLILSSCYHGMVTADMKITSPEGAGERIFSVAILKDGADDPKAPGKKVTGMFEDDPETGQRCFPGGIQPVFEVLKNAAPEEAGELTLEEKPDRYIISFKITFDSIEDFNAKCKKIVGEEYWNKYEIADATISVKDVEGGKEITYTEDIQLASASAIWGAKALIDLNDPNVFNNTGNGGYDISDGMAIFYTHMRTITIGDTTKEFPEQAEEVTITGVLKTNDTAPQPSDTPSEPDSASSEPGNTSSQPAANPSTGDSFNGILMLAAASAAGASLFYCRKRKK